MTPRTPPFDYARASALMEAQNIQAILVCSRANVGYLADYTYYTAQALPFLLEDGREWSMSFVGLPCDPSLGAFITPVTGEEGIIRHADPWIEDRRLWGPRWAYVGESTGSSAAPNDVADAAVTALRDRGLGDGKIALELAAVPAARYLRLRELLPKAEFVDAAPIMWALRSIKTPTEIQRLRHVAEVTDAAVKHAYDELDANCRETDFERRMAAALIDGGVTYGWCSIAYGPKGATLVQPTDRLPAPGEIVRVDLVGIYAGYYSDISRVAAFGRTPDTDAQAAHAAILEANVALRREAGPGVRCGDLHHLTCETLEQRGFRLLAPYAGHGIGRDVHEPPFLGAEDDAVLQPGMVLDFEPTMRVAGVGSVNIEDMVLITDNGCESLTKFPRDLLVFGG
ncbi:MAG: aminopeptidase P family protein [Chloroflexi bacterium]|nr:aminopeptidase P family protein [Chloroflexota bacterium]MBV9595938.1 aminopeptidase P family protein [Chloroflexota bacterium]